MKRSTISVFLVLTVLFGTSCSTPFFAKKKQAAVTLNQAPAVQPAPFELTIADVPPPLEVPTFIGNSIAMSPAVSAPKKVAVVKEQLAPAPATVPAPQRTAPSAPVVAMDKTEEVMALNKIPDPVEELKKLTASIDKKTAALPTVSEEPAVAVSEKSLVIMDKPVEAKAPEPSVKKDVAKTSEFAPSPYYTLFTKTPEGEDAPKEEGESKNKE